MEKQSFYRSLAKQAEALIADEKNQVANLANISAILNLSLERINWVGFYMLDDNEQLVLGPFQGKPACIRIDLGKGVCGTAADTATTQLVEDVHQFEGHIACDAASNSEIVVPLMQGDKVIGVLDIDSPEIGRFDNEDKVGLEHFVKVIEQYL